MLTTQSIIAESRRARQPFSSHLIEGCWRGYCQPQPVRGGMIRHVLPSAHGSRTPGSPRRAAVAALTWAPPASHPHRPSRSPSATAPARCSIRHPAPGAPGGRRPPLHIWRRHIPRAVAPLLPPCRDSALGRAERRGARQDWTHDHTNAEAILLLSLGEQVGARKVTTVSRGPLARIF